VLVRAHALLMPSLACGDAYTVASHFSRHPLLFGLDVIVFCNDAWPKASTFTRPLRAPSSEKVFAIALTGNSNATDQGRLP